tara:strand:+ start:1196 stop:1690 length:495 start_codon:yes stop_codon:yes gene_type:complete
MNQWRETTLLTTGAMESQDGIQRLLAAEQEAQAIVNAARQGTTFVSPSPVHPTVAPSHRDETLTRPTAPTDATTTEKTARLRQAKEEADAEVAAYRAQREAAYQEKLSQVRARTRPNSAQIPGALNLQIEKTDVHFMTPSPTPNSKAEIRARSARSWRGMLRHR